MTHDKLCQLAAGCPCRKWIPEEVECDNCFCDCALIVKVRNDEAEISLKRLGSIQYATGYGDAIADAVQAIEDLREDSPFIRATDALEAIVAKAGNHADTLRPDRATQ